MYLTLLVLHLQIKRWWSYVESAVVQIGKDTLEVKSGIQNRHYWVNGVERHRFKVSRNLDFTIGGFGGRFRAKNDLVVQYKLFLPDNQVLMIRSVKEMLRVEILYPTAKDFEQSAGLMGHWGSGAMIGRNGTEFEDPNAFGHEWQVQPSDVQLFHSVEGVQYPQQCKMPEMSLATARRLSPGSLTHADAEEACAKVDPSDRKNCIYDVIAMDDVAAVEGY